MEKGAVSSLKQALGGCWCAAGNTTCEWLSVYPSIPIGKVNTTVKTGEL
jgi:hypothetical protein